MKSRNSIIAVITVATLLFSSTDLLAWGQKGHDVTCAIAEQHLSCRARKKISKALDGKSLVYWANWMDNASHTPEHAYSITWHYKNVDADETYATASQNPNGDAVTAIKAQIEALKSGKLNEEAEALALKILIHVVGDMHCPMHMGHKSDLGGNRWQLQYFRKGTNLHAIWDTDLVESAHRWTYTEWVDEIDRVSRKEAAAIAEGSVDDWAAETWKITTRIYDTTPVGSKISYNYIAEWAPAIERQLLTGGIRLAAILNSIY